MRILGIDAGERRIGLAISDASRTLARPLTTLTVDRRTGDSEKRGTGEPAVDLVMHEIARLAAEEDGLEAIVVGLPARLDGTPTKATARVQAFIEMLRKRTSIPIVTEDERLSSREAESRLALRERDWRKRKHRLDSAAAAVILQDYLDRRT